MLFSERIIHWYTENRRDLPWRNTKDPYKIWISEIILQQTRVIQGLPYYERFLARFPSVRELAEASEAEVLKLWQGLGYYSRARNLHAAAKTICKQYENVFPRDYEKIRALPGIGHYTAAAIASFAYNLNHPVVDGNVIRFISRLDGIFEPAGSLSCHRRIMEILTERIDPENPGVFNQAIMEFGALGCTPSDPLCKHDSVQCPFATECYACRHDVADRLPVKKKKEELPVYELHYLLVTDAEDHLWIHRRGYDDLWRGMFDLPSLPPEYRPGNDLFSLGSVAENTLGIRFLKQYSQLLSHRKLRIFFYSMEADAKQAEAILKTQENCIRISRKQLSEYAVPKTVDRFFQDFNILKE